MSARVLITGALGFMGSHLADAYAAAGWEVTGLDNLTANVVGVTHPTIDTLLLGDVQNIEAGHVAGCDLVVHAASPVGAAGILPMQGTVCSQIVAGAQAVVSACLVADTPLIHISTSEVYGITGTATEADPLTVPARYSARLEYQAGKIAAEQVVGASVVRGLRAVQVRPWNMAGPREAKDKGFVIPRMVSQALAGEPVTVFGDGTQERAFTGVWDVCRFIMGLDPAADDFDGRPYNVGADRNRITINDLARLVIEVTGSSSEIVHTTGRHVFGPRYEEAAAGTKLPDSTRARATGWQPESSMTDIIARTAAEVIAPEGVAA